MVAWIVRFLITGLVWKFLDRFDKESPVFGGALVGGSLLILVYDKPHVELWVSAGIVSGVLYAAYDIFKPSPKYGPSPKEQVAARGRNLPYSFGGKDAWIAVRSDSSEKVAQALGLRDTRPIEWGAVYAGENEGEIFVTPPVKGWVFVIGSVPTFDTPREDQPALALIQKLGEKLATEVQYFATHRGVGHTAWARVQNGGLVRAFSVCDGELVADFGVPDEGEKQVLASTEANPRRQAGRKPGEPVRLDHEDDVFELAARWSLDPGTFDEWTDPVGPGIEGNLG